MRKYFPKYKEPVSHIWLCTRSLWISLFMRKILFSFLSVWWCTLSYEYLRQFAKNIKKCHCWDYQVAGERWFMKKLESQNSWHSPFKWFWRVLKGQHGWEQCSLGSSMWNWYRVLKKTMTLTFRTEFTSNHTLDLELRSCTGGLRAPEELLACILKITKI